MRIDDIYNALIEFNSDIGCTASDIATILNLSRANVSNDLNLLVSQGKARKIAGKPVYYKAVITENISLDSKTTDLDLFYKLNPSFYSVIAQAKAAILYPPSGMNVLLLGETGVGKSMLAEKMHSFAIETKQLKEGSPFVIFNCAEYANNPQLLLALLFGAKKGAYTGADEDRVGLLEKANNGVLFLDEVHRLPPEGQEMFFTFIDKGIYRRLGETNQTRYATVRIFAATTESVKTSLLDTFARRFPICITLPALNERSIEERFNLIRLFFSQEAKHLNSNIRVSTNALRALLSYDCIYNVGQLQADIKFACANAFVEYLSLKTAKVEIYSRTLPAHVRTAIYTKTEHRVIWNRIIGLNQDCVIFHANNDYESVVNDSFDNIYDMLNMKTLELKSCGIDGDELEETLERCISDYFQLHINGPSKHYNLNNLDSLIPPQILNLTEQLIQFIELKLQKLMNPRLYYGLADHILKLINRVKSNKCIAHPQINAIRTAHSEYFNVALDCLHIIEKAMEITLPLDEAGFLAMLFVCSDNNIETENNNVQVIVVAHGESTASSLVNTAHELLGVNYAIAFNSPLKEKTELLLKRIREHVQTNQAKSDIILLVDMGSFTTFSSELEKEFGIQVFTIQYVSTIHVIEAIQSAMNGNSLELVYRDVQQINKLTNIQPIPSEVSSLSIRDTFLSEKLAILTICTTGQGNAQAMEVLLTKSLSYRKSLIEFIPLDLGYNIDINALIDSYTQDHFIIAIVSPIPIKSDIPVFSLSDIFHYNGIAELQMLIDSEATYLLTKNTLSEILQNVDVDEIVFAIRTFNNEIIRKLSIKQSLNSLIGLIMHMACMLDRLKGNEHEFKFNDIELYLAQYGHEIELIRDSVLHFEGITDAKISDDELCMIHRFYRF